MERNELLEKLLGIAENIRDKKEEKLIEEKLKSDKWDLISPLILQITKDVYSDIETKRTEAGKEAEINIRKANMPEIQSTFKEISKLNESIKMLEIGIEFLENSFKAHKIAFGGVLLWL